MSKDLKLADLEAAEYVEQLKEKIVGTGRPVHSAHFAADPHLIKHRLMGYYFWIEDKTGESLAAHSFDHTLEEIELNLEYHKLLVKKVQEFLARMSEQSLYVYPLEKRLLDKLGGVYPGLCII